MDVRQEAQRIEQIAGSQTRNLNPHAEALVAMCIWGGEYSRQGDMERFVREEILPSRTSRESEHG